MELIFTKYRPVRYIGAPSSEIQILGFTYTFCFAQQKQQRIIC